jgi:hypothetical protein
MGGAFSTYGGEERDAYMKREHWEIPGIYERKLLRSIFGK